MDEGLTEKGNGTIIKSISHPQKSELKYGLENFFFYDRGYFIISDGYITSNWFSNFSSKFSYESKLMLKYLVFFCVSFRVLNFWDEEL
jgi:hypothetical protein